MINRLRRWIGYRRSTIITSQIPVDKWHELIGDPTYADAIVASGTVHNQ
jgi:hypothetical protein